MHLSIRASLLACVLSAAALPLTAQQHFDVPRSDGRTTPLEVYAAEGAGQGCAPLAVISHGAGGSENGYRYLAEAMSHMGYTTIVMGHRESGLAALRADMRADGFMRGLVALVTDTNAEQARLLDVGAALAWTDKQCQAPFRVLLGHSMGGETVMLESGAKNIIHVTDPPAGQDRFDAYVALSPEGPGAIFPEGAWSGIRKPMLILTGTRDQSLQGGPQARQVPWHSLPGRADHCQWMGVIRGATHMNFAGNGVGKEQVEPLVTQTIAEFLSGVSQGHACVAPASTAEMTLSAK
ncbi:MAG TPA: hypothetical protein VG893_01805 [Terracidiphilus sp.]|nr:hypothetical protein [Terracidiphilus sp.]